jgi:hypothetical protein
MFHTNKNYLLSSQKSYGLAVLCAICLSLIIWADEMLIHVNFFHELWIRSFVTIVIFLMTLTIAFVSNMYAVKNSTRNAFLFIENK